MEVENGVTDGIDPTAEAGSVEVLPETGAEPNPIQEGNSGDADSDTAIDTDSGNDTDDTTADEPVTFKYGEFEVEVNVPDDVQTFLGDKGFDAQALVNELYDGDFGLSDATKDKLYAAYGKSIVDGYLEGIQLKNDSTFAAIKSQQEAKTAADEKVWQETLQEVGGEENWQKFEEFALSTLSDEELAEFNKIMESGVRMAQKLAIADIKQKYAQKNGTGLDALIQPDGSASGGDVALSAAQYQQLIISGEYRKDPQKYDRLRRMGKERGI